MAISKYWLNTDTTRFVNTMAVSKYWPNTDMAINKYWPNTDTTNLF